MKIVLVSRGDASSGGAGCVAEQLCEGLRARDHQVTHIVRRKARTAYRSQSLHLPGLKGDVLLRNLVALDPSGVQLLLHPVVWRADLVHFHDFAVAYGALAALWFSFFKPVVLHFHDFSGVTGGCLYPRGCGRFVNGCGQCPQIGKGQLLLPVDLTASHFRLHQRIAASPRTVAVTPSEYMKQHALLGAWQGRASDIHVISNAVRTDLFTPERRTEARRRLGLSEENAALLFVALDVLDPRKGFDDLLRSYLRLAPSRQGLCLLIAGHLPAFPEELTPFRNRVKVCGFIDKDVRLAEIYAAADLYVVPSHADTFNITILEAMSCGTPTLAYRSGGIAEVIQDGCGGWLIEEISQQALTDAMSEKLEKLASPGLREHARQYVLDHFSIEQLISRHIKLYERVLGMDNRARERLRNPIGGS